MKSFVIFAFLILAYVDPAHCYSSSMNAEGWSIEPAAGLSMGVLKQTGVADIGTQVFNLELRAGYRFEMVSTGLSYMMGFGTGQQFGNKGDYKPTDIGLYVDYPIPMDFSLFASYIFSSSAKIQSSENSASFTGTGYRLGISWMGLSVGSILLETASRTFAKYDSNTLTNAIKDSSTSVSFVYPLK